MTWEKFKPHWRPETPQGGWVIDLDTQVGPVHVLLVQHQLSVNHQHVDINCWHILVSGVMLFEAELPLSIDEDAAKEHALKLLNGVVSEISAGAIKNMLEMMSNKRREEKHAELQSETPGKPN